MIRLTKIQRNALRLALVRGINRTGPGWIAGVTIDALERKGLIRWSIARRAYVPTRSGRIKLGDHTP